jgi:hypothetical protein
MSWRHLIRALPFREKEEIIFAGFRVLKMGLFQAHNHLVSELEKNNFTVVESQSKKNFFQFKSIFV